MTTNKLINNINHRINQFGSGYGYNTLMEDISDYIKEYERDNKKDIDKLKQENDNLNQEIEKLENQIRHLSNPNGYLGNFS